MQLCILQIIFARWLLAGFIPARKNTSYPSDVLRRYIILDLCIDLIYPLVGLVIDLCIDIYVRIWQFAFNSACICESAFLIARHMAAMHVFSTRSLCLLMDDFGSLEVRQWMWVGMSCRCTYTWAGRCWRPVLPHLDPNGIRRCHHFLVILMEGRELPGWPAGTTRAILRPRLEFGLWPR